MGAGNSTIDKHVVVIGGQFAGVATAKALEKAGLRVTVIEVRNCGASAL
jgi:NADPH-dependent 2,4-dienoyl-CoA reductase/sulfur reductase-like enzyme